MTRGLAGNKPASEGADNSRTAEPPCPVAVEKRGRASGRARMSVIPDFKAATIIPFLTKNIVPASTLYTDGLKSFAGLSEAGFQHITRIQPLRSQLRKGAESAVPLADRAIGNLQQRLTAPTMESAKPNSRFTSTNLSFAIIDADTRGRISDTAGPEPAQINKVRTNPGSKGSQPQPIGVC